MAARAIIKNAVKIFIGKLRRLKDQSNSAWLDRTTPFSRKFGTDRGEAIDRYFMYKFLYTNKKNISGSVLEVGDDFYTYKLGVDLERTVVITAGEFTSPKSECFNADLTSPQSLSHLGKFDCIIATNVLNFIFDFDAAVAGLASLTNPSTGVLLATAAGVCPISRFDYNRWGDFWRFNDMSIRKIFLKHFDNVEVKNYGNAPLAAAFVMGLAESEVPRELLDYYDADYPILIAVKASSPIKKVV